MKILNILTAILAFSISTSLLAANNYCGELSNAYGPFDYRNGAHSQNLYLVEMAHFTAEANNFARPGLRVHYASAQYRVPSAFSRIRVYHPSEVVMIGGWRPSSSP